MSQKYPLNSNGLLLQRSIPFIVCCAAGIAIFWKTLVALTALSIDDALYSHIALIPLFSLAIIIQNRNAIFSKVDYAPAIGMVALLAAFIVYLSAKVLKQGLEQSDYVSLCTVGIVLWIIGGFVGLYGKRAFRRAMFPLLFLFFAIPVPTVVLDRTIRFLQQMSAHTVDGFSDSSG